MQIGPLLGTGKVAEVFAVGSDVLKLYRPGFGAELARHEAKVLQALQNIPLDVPRPLGVIEHEGRWGLMMTRMAGRPLAESLDSQAALTALVDLNRQMHGHHVAGLPALKARLADRIGSAPLLVEAERARLLALLVALPDGDRLCHGDFHPLNIMTHKGNLSIIDWLDATSGPPAADVGRTYLLALHHMPALAEPYLAARLPDAGFDRGVVMAWLPVLAGARLAETVPDENERLLALVRGG